MRFHPLILPFVLGAAAALPELADAQSLRGSRASVDRMYSQARGQDLTFFRTGKGVRSALADGELVRLSGNSDYRVLNNVAYPYALPTTRTFVQRLAAQYRDACGERLVVTSAVRPTTYRLWNAADKSVHPAGMAIDIRKPTKRSCLNFLRQTLLHVEDAGAIEATEENRPPHFHVAVFPRQYLAYIGRSPRTKPEVTTRRDTRVAARGATTRYRVRRGDSLWAIARRHGTSVERIKDANDMSSSRVIAGQVLLIPGGR